MHLLIVHAGKQKVLIAHSLGSSAVVLSVVEAAKANRKVDIDAIMFVAPVMGPSVSGGPSVRNPAQNPKTEKSTEPKTMCAPTSPGLP